MKLSLTALALASALALTACASSTEAVLTTPEAKRDAKQALSLLNGSSELKLDKDAINLTGDHWAVRDASGKAIATVEGRALRTGNQIYAMLSPKGGLMAAEDQKLFSPARQGTFYDSEEKSEATLEKEVLALMAHYHLKDTQDKEYARLDQKFALTFQGDIKDTQGNTCWTFKRAFASMGASITLKKEAACLSAKDAVRLTVVANEVYEDQNNN